MLANKTSYFFLQLLIVSVLLFSCSYEENPCYNSSCDDNEVCVDGECVSFEPDESAQFKFAEEPKPDTVLVGEIYLTRFPARKPNNSFWDSDRQADIFIQFVQGGSILFASDSSITNARIQDLPIRIPLADSIRFSDLESSVSINVYDDDGNRFDEFMGGASFSPLQNNYPDTLSADLGGTVAFELVASYRF